MVHPHLCSRAGLFTRHAVVLAEGEVQPSGVFKVRQLGLPPPEPRQRTLEALGNVDPLRKKAVAPSPTSVLSVGSANYAGIAAAAADAADAAEVGDVAFDNAMLVVLSDVWLDAPSVLRRLAEVFRGYEAVGAQLVGSGKAATPLASFFTFVLCGNFASAKHATASSTGLQLRTLFKGLATVLAKTPMLARHAHFVLVPGPDDPSLAAPSVLPRAGLPRSLCTSLLEVIEHLTLASSPCRLMLCGQHIVIHREELLVKARRMCVLPPVVTNEETLNDHLVKTLIDNAHLCPLPPTEQAVYWQQEHAMWLHPAPDVLVLCDRQKQWQSVYEETLAFNPGDFSSGLSWMTYQPNERTAEESSLPEESSLS